MPPLYGTATVVDAIETKTVLLLAFTSDPHVADPAERLDTPSAPATAGAGIVAASALTAIDGSGATNEGVQIGFGAAGALAVGDRFSVDVFNPQLQQAQDAVVKIDNTTITKSSNTITDAIQGVTLNLLQADSANGVNLSV